MTIFILGGGPAGLAVADGIVDSKQDLGGFILIEQGEDLGGLAKTIEWENIGAHDLGPHKIFTTDEALLRRITKLLPDDQWLLRDKKSSIYLNGHYLSYPPSPFSLSGVFGFVKFVEMVAGYAYAKFVGFFENKKAFSFEDDLKARVGSPLYKLLFRPIALKLWDDPTKLDVKLSKGRVQTPSFFELLGRLLRIKKSSKFEALSFQYPKGGLSKIWDAIREKAGNNGIFLLNSSIVGLQIDKNNITYLDILDKKTNKIKRQLIGENDFVVSTLPLSLSVKFVSNYFENNLLGIDKETIVLNDLFLVFLHIDQIALMNDSWVFVPDSQIIFHRLSEQKAFDPEMTPNGSIVCCEIMSTKVRNLKEVSDNELINRTLTDLNKMGFSGYNVLSSKVTRLNKSYPVYHTGYEERLQNILNILDKIENFRTVGRQGAFNYIGTLDAMDIGYGFCDWITNKGNLKWDAERKRTEHYPVLD